MGFGDSLMAGYQLPEAEGFTAQLEAQLRQNGHENVTVINAGVSGDTSSGGRDRLDWSVPDETDLVILELGANDALRGIAPEITRENINAMIERLAERGITVLLAGMFAPPNMGDDYAVAFNAIYPDAAAQYNVQLYPFFMEGVIIMTDLLLDDGIHPNKEGVAVMVEGVAPLVETIILEAAKDS